MFHFGVVTLFQGQVIRSDLLLSERLKKRSTKRSGGGGGGGGFLCQRIVIVKSK